MRGGGQSCVRGMQASALSNEFCSVQVLEGLKNCPLCQIVRCQHLGAFLITVLMVLESGTCQVSA